MIRTLIPAIALATSASPAAAEVTVEATGPIIEITITENVTVDPDIANLSAGVTTLAPTAVEAMRQNASQMHRVIERIEVLGVDEDDIQTSGVSVGAEYRYDDGTNQPRFTGYRVSNRVNVVLRDISDTGKVLDALVAASATDLGGIGWAIDNPEPAQDQARQAAFATGRERAIAYARMSGYSDVRLLEISETIMGSRPFAQDANIVTAASRSESTPVRPGQVQAGVSVNFTFEMVQ